MRQAIRARHYSKRTEKTYVRWIKRFIFFHGKGHPLEMGETEVNQFLRTSQSTRKSAPLPRTRRLARFDRRGNRGCVRIEFAARG